MGFSFHATGRVKRTEECWIQSQTINNGVPRAAAKTKEKPGGVTGGPLILTHRRHIFRSARTVCTGRR